MALYPCDWHSGRYTGPQRTAYPALLNATTGKRRKMRLCGDCFSELNAWLEAHVYTALDERPIECCQMCGDQDDTSIALFCTMYDHKQERVDWYGRVCHDCAEGPAQLVLFGKAQA